MLLTGCCTKFETLLPGIPGRFSSFSFRVVTRVWIKRFYYYFYSEGEWWCMFNECHKKELTRKLKNSKPKGSEEVIPPLCHFLIHRAQVLGNWSIGKFAKQDARKIISRSMNQLSEHTYDLLMLFFFLVMIWQIFVFCFCSCFFFSCVGVF